MTELRQSHMGAILFGLSLAAFAAFQQFKIPVVLPILLESYGYERTLAGGLMSVYALVGLAFSVFIGRLVARFGSFGPLLLGLGLFLGGNLTSLAWPENAVVMLSGRAMEGLGFAVAAIAGPVMANANASQQHLPLVAGFMATWIPVGQLTASFLAPLFLYWPGWQGLWWFAALSTVGFALWMSYLHRSNPDLFSQPEKTLKSNQPAKRLSTVQLSALVATGAVFMCWSAQYFAYMTWLPQFLVEQHGVDVSDASIGYLIPVALVMIFCIAAGGLMRSGVPLPWLLFGALFLQCAAWWTLPFVASKGSGLVSLVVYGASAGIVPGCLFALPSRVMGSGKGTVAAFGIVMTGRNIGVFTGPLLLALTFGAAGSWDLASPVFGAITTACLPIALFLFSRLRRIAEPAAVP